MWHELWENYVFFRNMGGCFCKSLFSYVSENIVYVDGKLVSGDAISLGDDERKCSLKEFLQHTKVSEAVFTIHIFKIFRCGTP